MKKLILVLSLILLTGCRSGNPADTDTRDMKTRCIDGVVYFLFKEGAGYSGYGFMSPKFTKEGKVQLCSTGDYYE